MTRQKVDREERCGDFDVVAERRYAEIVATGKAIPWSDMRRWLEGLAAGKKTARPVARKLAR